MMAFRASWPNQGDACGAQGFVDFLDLGEWLDGLSVERSESPIEDCDASVTRESRIVYQAVGLGDLTVDRVGECLTVCLSGGAGYGGGGEDAAGAASSDV
jgi:hypothetical protein